VKSWDVIIVGGGIIGLSLSIALRKRGAQVLIVERGEPGQEASHAAAGMLVDCPDETPAALQALATASASLYPEFAHELRDESGVDVDLRDYGTIVFSSSVTTNDTSLPCSFSELEPALASLDLPARLLNERSVDPRALTAAALKAARHRAVDIASGSNVTSVLVSNGRAYGVATEKTQYAADVVVNCAGAWAGQFPPYQFPTRPVKGQMLAVVGQRMLTHVVRSPEVYLVPRSDGRILIGATVEEAGYDKRTDPDTIQRLRQAAVQLLPALAQARVLEAWAGLRPGTPDGLPILGETDTPGYFVAAGHFRDGILLAPVTAEVMAQVITGARPDQDIGAFSPARFDRLQSAS
jgi:glycine oxidase